MGEGNAPDTGREASEPVGTGSGAAAHDRESAATGNDPGIGWGEPPRESGPLSEDDERLLRERPPHWE